MDQMRTGEVFDRNRVQEPVVIVGAGATGTAVALLLAKLNVPIMIVDDDVVEGHNLCNQVLYGPNSIGLKKVYAVATTLKELTDTRIISIDARIKQGSLNDKHIFLCVDNMKTREDIATWCSSLTGGTLVDGRMSAYDWSAYLVRRDIDEDRRRYLQTIVSDNDVHVDRTACGVVMSIGATAQMVASHMVWLWMDAVMGRPAPNAIHQGMKPWFNQQVTWGD